MTALAELPTMDEATSLSTTQVAEIVQEAIIATKQILRGEFDDAEHAKAQLGAAHLVFTEFLQAPQITLPHPGSLFAGAGFDGGADDEITPEGGDS